MLTKNQIEILNLFRKNIFLKSTILEIKKKLNKKSYQRVHEAIKEFENKNIINSKKIGNSNQISLELSRNSIIELSYLDEQESFSKKIPNIEEILEFKEFLDDIVIVTGSYSRGNQTSKSDIDVVIITKEDAFKKQKLIENLTMLFIPKIHPIVISYKDFVDMLLDIKENYGKEIFKNRLLFRNSKRYYELIKEAINNGFRS
ncbi:MAG: nucleotidyltransferase domain-containing protein [Nanoarchaeota archaeon]